MVVLQWLKDFSIGIICRTVSLFYFSYETYGFLNIINLMGRKAIHEKFENSKILKLSRYNKKNW